jgi:serine/threonine-protein kinase
MTDNNCPQCGARLTPWEGKCPSCGTPVSTSTAGDGEFEAREAVRARLAEAALGEYEVVGELGRGGMGWVFLGRDRKLGRLAALKVLPSLDALRPASVERFRREAETAARLSHPNIVPVYGAGGDMATPYFAMAYVEGGSLAERIAKEGSLPVSEALRIAREVGSALAYAHRQGIVHRDVKPQNIMLEREAGRALVTDFGIARAAAAERMTMSGMAIGTPGYMAPEQAAGASDVDGRADGYALGVVLFEMLTGKRLEAFEGGEWPISSASVRRSAQRTRPDLPSGLVDVVARAAAPRREDRWPSVEALLTALEPFVTPGAPPVAGRRRVWWYVAGAGVVVAAAIRLGALSPFQAARRQVPIGAAASRTIAVMRFGGDTAAASSLLDMLLFPGFSPMLVADSRVFSPAVGDPASPEVRAKARKAGASWILHGYIRRAGAGFELQVSVVNVETGQPEELGRFTVAELGLAAADSVVLRLAGGRAGHDLGLATGTVRAPISLDAVRAWRSAEDAFRRADYAAAVAGYDSVIALDSNYALASYKRFLAVLQQEPTEDRIREALGAVRDIVPRVGPREAKLLTAYLTLFDRGNVGEAEAQLRRLVEEDPTFLDGWFALGEVRYHFGALAGLPPDSAVAAFDRALSLWPGAAPAFMHLIGLNLWLGDEDKAEDYLTRYLAQDSTSTVGRTIQLARDVLFGSLKGLPAIRRRLGEMDDQVLELSALAGVQTWRDRADLANAYTALDEMTRQGRAVRVRSEGAKFLVATLLAQGRWGEAASRLEDLQGKLRGDAELARWPAIAFLVGYGSRDQAGRASAARLAARWPDREERAMDLWLAGSVEVETGDSARARTRLLELEAMARRAPPAVAGMHSALLGRIREAEADPAAAVAAYEVALAHLDPARAPFTLLYSAWIPRYRLVRLRLAAADTARALALLEAQDFLAASADQVVRGPAWLLHGRILEATGERPGAIRNFQRAYDLLRYAEPPWDAVRDSAQAGLTRLGAPR